MDGDERSMRERMLAGDLYIADDPELREARTRAAVLIEAFNRSSASDPGARRALLVQLLGGFGDGSEILPPLHCDYGSHTRIGARTFINVGAVLLDVAPITIGDDVQLGPYAQLLTATHPLAPRQRREKWESGRPIAIGDNVWLGGGVIVAPGVSIGDNTVVGAGAMVTGDLPSNVLAVGAPARVIRALEDPV